MIGLVIGAPWPVTEKNITLLRGGLLGLLISFAFYSTSGFVDPLSFVAGIFYGVILEICLSKYY